MVYKNSSVNKCYIQFSCDIFYIHSKTGQTMTETVSSSLYWMQKTDFIKRYGFCCPSVQCGPCTFFLLKLTRQYNMFTAWKKTNYYNGDHWHCSRGCCANMISVTSILCACDHEYIIFFLNMKSCHLSL